MRFDEADHGVLALGLIALARPISRPSLGDIGMQAAR